MYRNCTLKVLANWVTNIVIIVDFPNLNLAIEFSFTEIIK
jgi:hypothetical protein